MQKNGLIRKLYLYCFSLLGLVLIVIGCVSMLDLGLRVFIFTKADKDQEYYTRPYPPKAIYDASVPAQEISVSEEELQMIEDYLQNYQEWEAQNKEISYISSQRHRTASRNLALIIIGLPLYLYHWTVIKKEYKNNKA